MKYAYLLVVLLFTLSSCGNVTKNEYEENTPVVSGNSAKELAVVYTDSRMERDELQNRNEYLAKNENELSELDIETTYEMSVGALTDYYKAIWNGLDIELSTYINNENLKQYTQKKIDSQYDLYL